MPVPPEGEELLHHVQHADELAEDQHLHLALLWGWFWGGGGGGVGMVWVWFGLDVVRPEKYSPTGR